MSIGLCKFYGVEILSLPCPGSLNAVSEQQLYHIDSPMLRGTF